MPNASGSDHEELDAIIEMTKSRGWSVFRRLSLERIGWLSQQALSSIRKQEDRKAGEFVARRDEIQDVLDLVKYRSQTLTKLIEEDG